MGIQNLHFTGILLLICVTCGCRNAPENYEHRNQIVDVLRNYRDAINTQNADAAVPLVSQASLRRFEQFRDWALHDTTEELQQRSLYEQIHVLSLRHHLRGQNLATMNGTEILAGLIRTGGLSTKLLKHARFGNCIFDHERNLSFVQLYDEGILIKNRITCIHEESGWKVHLIGMESTEEKSYQAILDNNDISPDEFVQKIVSDWTQEDKTINLWQPLQ